MIFQRQHSVGLGVLGRGLREQGLGRKPSELGVRNSLWCSLVVEQAREETAGGRRKTAQLWAAQDMAVLVSSGVERQGPASSEAGAVPLYLSLKMSHCWTVVPVRMLSLHQLEPLGSFRLFLLVYT